MASSGVVQSIQALLNSIADGPFPTVPASTIRSVVASLQAIIPGLGVFNYTATTDPTSANDNTQGYGPGSIWFNTSNNREWLCISAATGAAVWSFGGASYANGGYNPSNEVTQFGSAPTALMAAEGNINRQISSAGVQPGATGGDNVLAVYSIPPNSFDGIGNRALTITAAGSFGATANTKTVKLIYNPATAVVGSTVGAGGITLCTTGAQTQNGGGWQLMGTVMKYGAAGSNTQLCINNGAVGTTHFGVTAPAVSTAAENGAILVAVTGNAATAVSDIVFNWLEVNAMN